MNAYISEEKVKRYYYLRQQIKELQLEADKLNEEIKGKMNEQGISETVIANYHLSIRIQDHSRFDNKIVNYLREIGYPDLIIETYEHDKLKLLEKLGRLDEQELQKYRIENIIKSLYVKPTK